MTDRKLSGDDMRAIEVCKLREENERLKAALIKISEYQYGPQGRWAEAALADPDDAQ